MRPARKTLRRPDDLIAAGLAAARAPRRDRAGRRALCAGAHRRRRRAHRSRRCRRSDRAPVRSRSRPSSTLGPRRPPTRSATIAHSPVEGIVHRYPDRVLLKPVHVCAVYCRFCFRREMVGRGRALSRAELDAALDYIRAHSRIWEVILTGGDPLVLSPRRLARDRRGARGDRACQDHPRAHPRAGGRAGARHAGARSRAQGAAARRPMSCSTPTMRAS